MENLCTRFLGNNGKATRKVVQVSATIYGFIMHGFKTYT